MGEKLFIGFLILVGVLSVLFLAAAIYYGVLDNSVKMGFVVDKKFKAAHTTTTMHYNSVTKTMMPLMQYHSDAWYIYVRGIDMKGEERVREVQVTEEDYKRTPLNDFWEE